MKKRYLILGATGSIGCGFTRVLLDEEEEVTILVRGREKAVRLFGQPDNLEIVEGDVMTPHLLQELARNKDVIFHGLNASYEHWASFMPPATQQVIEAAEQARATLLFPGNNYNFGNVRQPISELTPFNPCSPLGVVRVELEKMLKAAADRGAARVIILRLAEVWGPNVMNKGVAPIFDKALAGKAIPWFIRTDIPQQWVYNLDAGRIFYALSQREGSRNFEVFNYGGATVPTMRSWMEQIARQADAPFREKVMPKWMMRLLGLFILVVREVNSLAYKYENSILLDDRKLYAILPDFQATPMERAIDEALHWYWKKDSRLPSSKKVNLLA